MTTRDNDRRVLAAIAGGADSTVPLHDALGGILGALYVTLERLEAAGLVRTWQAPGGPERGGRPRRMVALTDAGARALKEGL